MDEAKRSRLIEVIRKLSYKEGDFTLASGKTSKFYIDLKATTLHPEGATLIGELGAQLLQSGLIKADAIGGLTLGADPIATAISVVSFQIGFPIPSLIVRKESKGHGTDQFVEGKSNVSPGARVLVLEDVITTGGSSIDAILKLKKEGFEPVGVLTVVDRQSGGADRLKSEFGLNLYSLASIEEIQSLSITS